MVEKDPREPSLELPSLGFGRWRRQKKSPSPGSAPAAPESAPAPPESAPAPPESAPVADQPPPGSGSVPQTAVPPRRDPPARRLLTTDERKGTGPADESFRRAPSTRTRPGLPPGRRLPLPAVGSLAAALLTGALVGVLTVGLTWAGFRLCEVLQGTSSCGDPGFLLLLAIMIAMASLGAALLRGWHVPEPGSTSLLAVGLLAVVALLFLADYLFSSWMILVVPIVAMATFALAHRVTTAAVGTADR